MMSYIYTLYGGLVNPWEVDEDQIYFEDIFTALGNTCRFGGHTSQFYSVAEHSLFCHRRSVALGADIHTQVWALMHDAHEAYTGDIPTPFKPRMPEVAAAQKKLDDAIQFNLIWRYGFNPDKVDMKMVKQIDRDAVFVESRALQPMVDHTKWAITPATHWGETAKWPVGKSLAPAEAGRLMKLAFEILTDKLRK